MVDFNEIESQWARENAARLGRHFERSQDALMWGGHAAAMGRQENLLRELLEEQRRSNPYYVDPEVAGLKATIAADREYIRRLQEQLGGNSDLTKLRAELAAKEVRINELRVRISIQDSEIKDLKNQLAKKGEEGEVLTPVQEKTYEDVFAQEDTAHEQSYEDLFVGEDVTRYETRSRLGTVADVSKVGSLADLYFHKTGYYHSRLSVSISGAMKDYYDSLKGPESFLGLPVSNEYRRPDGVTMIHFEGGVMLNHGVEGYPAIAVGAPVDRKIADIFALWTILHWDGLSQPRGDSNIEISSFLTEALTQHFIGDNFEGAMYRHLTGPYKTYTCGLSGDIFKYYRDIMGGSKGIWGLPISNIEREGRNLVVYFENGMMLRNIDGEIKLQEFSELKSILKDPTEFAVPFVSFPGESVAKGSELMILD